MNLIFALLSFLIFQSSAYSEIFVDDFLENCLHLRKDRQVEHFVLDPSEVLAFHRYTGASHYFINRELVRTSNVKSLHFCDQATFKFLIRGLKKLEKYQSIPVESLDERNYDFFQNLNFIKDQNYVEGENLFISLYRGTKQEYFKNLKKGEVLTYPTIISASLEKDIASRFIDSDSPRLIQFEVKPRLLIPSIMDEKEILISPNTCFEVVDLKIIKSLAIPSKNTILKYVEFVQLKESFDCISQKSKMGASL